MWSWRAPLTSSSPDRKRAAGVACTTSPTSGRSAMLDATATCDPSGTQLTIAVVNRDRDRAHRASIELGEAAAKGDALVSEVNGASVEATNSFDTPRAVDVRESRVSARGHRFEHEFPAHSISVLRVPLG